MKLFNLDLHISVIADVKDVIERLYGSNISITDWSLSGHTWVFGKKQDQVDIVNSNTWIGLNETMVHEFLHRYYNELKEYDGFIITYGIVFARLFEVFQKPIIMVNCCRYDLPYCWTNNYEQRNNLNSCLQRLYAKKLLIPIVNNKADRDYLKLGTGIDSIYIPSLCLYTKCIYDFSYSQTKPFVSYNTHQIPLIEGVDQRPEKFDWKWMLCEHRALIQLPYEISIMSIFEQYSSYIPLFFPSKTFYKQLILEHKADMATYSGSYWKYGCYPPEYEVIKSLDWWLDRCDFYPDQDENDGFFMKYIHYYESWDHLKELLKTFNRIVDQHQEIVEYINKRKENILLKWKETLSGIYHIDPHNSVSNRENSL